MFTIICHHTIFMSYLIKSFSVFSSIKTLSQKLFMEEETENHLENKKNIKTMKLLGTSLLQKGEKIKLKEKAVEMLRWQEGDNLVQFYDEKENALVVKKLGEVMKSNE